MLCKVVVNKLLRVKGLSLIGCGLCSGPGPFALRARTRVRALSLVVDEGEQGGCKALGVPAWLGAMRHRRSVRSAPGFRSARCARPGGLTWPEPGRWPALRARDAGGPVLAARQPFVTLAVHNRLLHE